VTHPHDNPVRAELQSLDQRRADTLADARGSAAAWEMVARVVADRADRLQERVLELETR
jgi:hypothetical protein